MKRGRKISWDEVPKDILIDLAKTTGIDPRKLKWIEIDIEPKKDV